MDLKPMEDRLIVKRADDEPAEKKTESGLFVPTEQKPTEVVEFEILAVGPEIRGLVAGDRILASMLAGEDLEWNGEFLLVMAERDVIAKVEGA